MNTNDERVVNIENTDIIPIPEESRKILNKKLIKEDPLTPYKKLTKGNYILLVLFFMILIVGITCVIYKFIIIK